MSQVIRISDELYRRLEALAEGFDTPNNVIERLLEYYGQNGGESLPLPDRPAQITAIPADLDLIFYPPGEERFKRELLKSRKAYVKLHKTDGTSETKSWEARKFSESSDVSRNLRSGFLRGWKKKGIFKAEVSIDPSKFA
ncbi:hypothetical protein [Parahaliea mediterranea]|uniref:hypothetical protein n=1 Tax=Parahaliea mediterranea TaxID=651086 RepID=UPI001300497F|nr:hypothetical protein [Parahaliea mediterranea]